AAGRPAIQDDGTFGVWTIPAQQLAVRGGGRLRADDGNPYPDGLSQRAWPTTLSAQPLRRPDLRSEPGAWHKPRKRSSSAAPASPGWRRPTTWPSNMATTTWS